jgi:hypothetical protein
MSSNNTQGKKLSDKRGLVTLPRMPANQYFQCLLRRGQSETTGWLEKRAAKAGAEIELLPSRELWTVAKVYEHGLPADVLKEHQLLNRNSLLSVEPMQRPGRVTIAQHKK